MLISAGVGITPVAAILDDLSARGVNRPGQWRKPAGPPTATRSSRRSRRPVHARDSADARAELIRRGLPTTQIRYEVFGPDMFVGSSLGEEAAAR